MTEFQDTFPEDEAAERIARARRAQASVEAAKAPAGGVDPEMLAFGLKLAFGVALFQLSLIATLYGQFTRG